MRSDIIKKGIDKAPHRSLLRATGQIREEGDMAPFPLGGGEKRRLRE